MILLDWFIVFVVMVDGRLLGVSYINFDRLGGG